MKIRLVDKYPEGVITLEEMQKRGVKGRIQSARRVPKDLETYIDSVVNKKETGETFEKDGKTYNEVVLDGVNAAREEGTAVTLLSGTHATFEGKAENKTYGTDEFKIALTYPEGVTWNDYLNKIYAVTVSSGGKTVGAVPWIDWYGEKADAPSSPHYNNVEVALNSGKVIAENQAVVHRFDDFYENGALKSGYYTVTVYADGFNTVTAEDIWVPERAGAEIALEDGTATSAAVTFVKPLPDDFEPVFKVDGKDASFADGIITFDAVKPGSHTVTVESGNLIDGNKKYGDVTGTFNYTLAEAAVKYDGEKLVATGNDITTEDYAAAVTQVSVDGTLYNPKDRRNPVTVINSDGTIDLSKTAAAEKEGPVEITVTAKGYPELTFTTNDVQYATVGAIAAKTYTGKALKPALDVRYGDKVLTEGIDYKAAYTGNTNAGTAKVTVTGIGNYTGVKTVTFKIKKAAQKMTAKANAKTVKFTKVKKKAQVITKAVTVKNAKGKVTYKKVSGAAKLTVSKAGKITVKKGTKKGLYKVKIKVTAAGNNNFNAASKTVNVKIRVK